MPEHEDDEAAGHPSRQAIDAEQQHQRAHADGDRGAVRVAEVLEQRDELADRVAVALLDPEQLRELADGDEEREAEHEARHDRAREELRDEPEPQQTPASRNMAPASSTIPAASAAYSSGPRAAVAHRRGDQDRRCRGAGHHDVAARAQDGVGDERHEQGVQAGLRRQAGEPGVGDHLRDQQAPDRRARR